MNTAIDSPSLAREAKSHILRLITCEWGWISRERADARSPFPQTIICLGPNVSSREGYLHHVFLPSWHADSTVVLSTPPHFGSGLRFNCEDTLKNIICAKQHSLPRAPIIVGDRLSTLSIFDAGITGHRHIRRERTAHRLERLLRALRSLRSARRLRRARLF